MTDPRPLVSLIVPHLAGTQVLIYCLEAVYTNTTYPNFEIILVDNGSSDGSVAAALERFPDVRVLRLEENQGYAGGCNRGIEESHGAYVLLLNDDTEVEPGWLEALVRSAEEDPTIGACQPKIRSFENRADFEYSGAGGGLMDVYGYPFCRGRLMGHVEPDLGQYDDPAEIFWASGVCLLLRRSVLEETGLFDEVFFAYQEEIDLSWRVHLMGFRVVYVPAATVYHVGGYSLERQNLKRMYLNHRNSMIMVLKNYAAKSLIWVLPVKIAVELFILFGALVRNARRSRAVVMSFAWLLTHVPTVLRLRSEVQGRRCVPDSEILPRLYRGMAPIWYFLFGIRRVTDLPDIDGILHQPYRPRDLPHEVVHPLRRNFLYAYLDQAPISLALMRAVECAHLAPLSFERPILDVGCGDGTFGRILFNGVMIDAGVDADEREIARAHRTRCYGELQAARIEELPFESQRFATVYSNCVLEHVRDIDGALSEIRRVLKPGGFLYMTIPNPRCATYPFWTALFARVRLRALANWYSSLTLRLFKAENILEAEGWKELLERAGFSLEHHEPYMPLRAARIQDLFLPTGLLSVLAKALFERKFLFPRLHRVKVRVYRHLLRPAYEERAPEASATMIVARKPAAGAP